MAALLIKNIQTLVQVRESTPQPVRGAEMAQLPSIDNAWLLIKGGTIANYGPMDTCPRDPNAVIDATGRLVLPAWVDAHTHLVFPFIRDEEFVDRIRGLSYGEIAAKGGGILNSARTLAEFSEQELVADALVRLDEMAATGTGAIEIKSGYGLSVQGELKMLRVIKRLKKKHPIVAKATFLGAHAIPSLYKDDREGYIQLILREMLPVIEKEELADFIDVFCEKDYFTPQEMDRILEAGAYHGLPAKVHVNQFNSIGGIETAIEYRALSVDHLEVMTDADITALAASKVMPTVLPSCSFFLNIPYAPARRMMDAGLPICIATDYNPGSSPSGNMPFVLSLACIKLRMLPEEAINAATINAAFALGLENELGSITRGKTANIIITEPMDSIAQIPYSFGSNPVW
ncbi:MAG: imidazolonepropionase, partial [Flavobacteriales bacterium]|nr:imidazolonepropionase [Flavobacteriales bacterium]